MISLILSVLVVSQTSPAAGVDILNQMANRYSSADGIQWTIHSQTYSQIFEETTSASLQFYFNPPDTFNYTTDSEQVLGIADTIWILSKTHKQIQKKLNNSYMMPTDFIITWDQRYNLGNYSVDGDLKEFELEGKEKDISPAHINIKIDNRNHIRAISYKDISGDDVTLTFTKEKLNRSRAINLFYLHLPKDYRLIDLIE
jgi:outer membrane lipoprotein-sorting protein